MYTIVRWEFFKSTEEERDLTSNRGGTSITHDVTPSAAYSWIFASYFERKLVFNSSVYRRVFVWPIARIQGCKRISWARSRLWRSVTNRWSIKFFTSAQQRDRGNDGSSSSRWKAHVFTHSLRSNSNILHRNRIYPAESFGTVPPDFDPLLWTEGSRKGEYKEWYPLPNNPLQFRSLEWTRRRM